MNLKNSDSKIIAKLLEETYESASECSLVDNSEGLHNHFTSKSIETNSLLDRFLTKESIKSAELIDYKTFCRFTNEGKVLDFPKNWTLFQDIEYLYSQGVGQLVLGPLDDDEALLEIFNKLFKAVVSIHICYEENKLKMVLPKSERERNLLDHYFKKHSLKIAA